jgi:hypothetical protein
MSHRVILIATLCAALVQSVVAQEKPANADIRVVKRVMREPPADLGSKQIHITVDDSEKITRMLVDHITAKGYKVVDDNSKADIRLQCYAKFNISGAGKDSAAGNVEQFVQTGSLQLPDTPNYTYQTTNPGQIAAPLMTLGVIPTPDIIVWITQKFGIAGAFNKALTGDPRGMCLNENCNKFTQRVLVACSGDVSWILQYQSINEKILIDQVIEMALSGMRDQFPPLEKTFNDHAIEVSEK